MLSSLVAHVRQQWMGALALFLVLTGGIAYAANTVFSRDIVNNQIRSVDVRNERAGGGLTGADIKNQSGVYTCTHGTVRLGELCFRARNSSLQWFQAVGDCAGLNLRLPSYAEAVALAARFDLPNVDDQELFWTAD